MNLLQKAENTMAYFKCGIFGFQGDGKTYTSSQIAEGILKKVGIPKLAYFDTETGSDWMVPKMSSAGIEVFQVKQRSFNNLILTIKECVDSAIPFLIIDSITHVWRDLINSYDQKLNRHGKMQFQDWAIIKKDWQVYTDLFINSPLHIIVCGRAGYDYDYDFNQDGSKDLVKTGTKMKVEGEFGFEPSLVIEMERISENRKALDEIKNRKAKQSFQPDRGSRSLHKAFILKDRSDTINGRSFLYPNEDNRTIFEDITPHFEMLNIGGSQLGVGTEDSQDRFDKKGRPEWKQEKDNLKIALEEIQGCMVSMWPGTDKESKKAKADFLMMVFETRAWSALEQLPLDQAENAVIDIRKFEILFNEKPDTPMDSLWAKATAPITNDDDIFGGEEPPPEKEEPTEDTMPEATTKPWPDWAVMDMFDEHKVGHASIRKYLSGGEGIDGDQDIYDFLMKFKGNPEGQDGFMEGVKEWLREN